MSAYTRPLTVTAFGDVARINGAQPSRQMERTWILDLDGFEYHVGEEGSGEVIAIPRGFITDLASVPRALWWIYPPFGLHAAAAVVHDWLYRSAANRAGRTRRECDRIFLEAMRVKRTPAFRARVMWAAVRTFGWRAFR